MTTVGASLAGGGPEQRPPRVGEVPPAKAVPFDPALAGLRVLEVADPTVRYCGKVLADLGAEVILVEPPMGARARSQPPFRDGRPGLETSLDFAYFHANKRSVTLNLATADGRAVFLQLAASVDVVLEGGRPGRMAAWGLAFEELQKVNPRLDLASITPFGQNGPYARYRATDAVAFAMGGIMSLSGSQDREPVVAPGEEGMMVAGVQAAFGILAAARMGARTGRGQRVDVSIMEVLAAQENLVSMFATGGPGARREGSQHRVAAPGRVYPCRDGFIHLFISPVQAGAWERLLDWLGPGPLREPCWSDSRYRRAHVSELDKHVAAWTRGLTRQELYEGAQARKIPCAPVNTMASFAADPHVQARGFIGSGHHAVLGTYRFLASAFRWGGQPVPRRRPAPLLGEHNEEVYVRELGYTADWLGWLRRAGVI